MRARSCPRCVITSYSIHYTKLYDEVAGRGQRDVPRLGVDETVDKQAGRLRRERDLILGEQLGDVHDVVCQRVGQCRLGYEHRTVGTGIDRVCT